MTKRPTTLLIASLLLVACAKDEPPLRSVSEFVDNPLLLEAAMVRCSRDRAESRYDPTCVNAREAVRRIQAKEERVRRAELEARSEAKRRALRRTLEAQAEARRRAAAALERRKEAEYLAQFGVAPPTNDGDDEALAEGNLPLAVIPRAEESVSAPATTEGEALPAGTASNAPVAEQAPDEDAEDEPNNGS
ncbi:MAG: EexN family lipoprotein [Woeseiaceae bacterium]